jgi:hypothetical protein
MSELENPMRDFDVVVVGGGLPSGKRTQPLMCRCAVVEFCNFTIVDFDDVSGTVSYSNRQEAARGDDRR